MLREKFEADYASLYQVESKDLYELALNETVSGLLPDADDRVVPLSVEECINMLEENDMLNDIGLDTFNDELQDCYSNHFYNQWLDLPEDKREEYVTLMLEYFNSVKLNLAVRQSVDVTPSSHGIRATVTVNDVDFEKEFELNEFVQWAYDNLPVNFLQEWEKYRVAHG